MNTQPVENGQDKSSDNFQKRRQLSINIDPVLHNAFKMVSTKHEISMGDACAQAIKLWMESVEEQERNKIAGTGRQSRGSDLLQSVLDSKKTYNPSSTERQLFVKLLAHRESRGWLFRFAVVLFFANDNLVNALLCTIKLYFDAVKPKMKSSLSLDSEAWGRDDAIDAERNIAAG